MKENWQRIVIAVLAALIIGVSLVVTFKNKSVKEETAVLEFITYDALENKSTLDKTIVVKEGDVVAISTDKTIKILVINEEGIKISREVLKYKIISEEERKAEPYTETVIENIMYDATTSIDADARDPFGPAYEAPRYSSYIKVIKEK